MIPKLVLMMMLRLVLNLAEEVITCLSSFLRRQKITLMAHTPSVSGPRDVKRCTENFGENNVKITFFTSAYYDFEYTQTYRGDLIWTAQQQMYRIIFKAVTNQDTGYSVIQFWFVIINMVKSRHAW